MPKNIIDYSNTIIYKIYCKDNAVTDFYIGHTTNFIKRKYQHKVLCCSNKKIKMYDVIRNNGGWDNWNMTEIARYNCQDSTEARIREQEHYDLLKPTLNTLNPISNNVYNILSIDDIKNDNDKKKYYCEYCDYKCFQKCDWDRHILRPKHLVNQHENSKETKKQEKTFSFQCEKCNKYYKNRSGLWKHKKSCSNKSDTYKTVTDNGVTNKNNEKLLETILKENKEIKEFILEIMKNGTIVNSNH
jgi:hypothetical protein